MSQQSCLVSIPGVCHCRRDLQIRIESAARSDKASSGVGRRSQGSWNSSFGKFTSVVNLIKHFTIVKLWLGNCPYYDSRVLIYAHKVCKRLAAGKSYHKENLYKHYILPSLGCIGIVVSVQAFYFDDTSSYHADSMSAVVTIENLNLKDRCANIMSNYSLPPLIHYL